MCQIPVMTCAETLFSESKSGLCISMTCCAPSLVTFLRPYKSPPLAVVWPSPPWLSCAPAPSFAFLLAALRTVQCSEGPTFSFCQERTTVATPCRLCLCSCSPRSSRLTVTHPRPHTKCACEHNACVNVPLLVCTLWAERDRMSGRGHSGDGHVEGGESEGGRAHGRPCGSAEAP